LPITSSACRYAIASATWNSSIVARNSGLGHPFQACQIDIEAGSLAAVHCACLSAWPRPPSSFSGNQDISCRSRRMRTANELGGSTEPGSARGIPSTHFQLGIGFIRSSMSAMGAFAVRKL